MPLDLPDLLELSKDELDELFRESPAGEIPQGDADGIVLVAPGTEVSWLASKIIHLVAWRGSSSGREKGDLKNKILPFGLHAVRAKVYKEASWFDGKETIVLDYSKTSLSRPQGARRDPRGLARRLSRARLLGARQDRALRAQVRRAVSPMPYQRALTIAAPVRAGAREELEQLLESMGDGVANGSVLDFGALTGVHFARLAVVPRGRRTRAAPDPDDRRRRSAGAASGRARGAGRDRPALRPLRGLRSRGPTGSPTCAGTRSRRPPRYVNTRGRTRRPDQAGGAAAQGGPGLPRRRATGAAVEPEDVRRAVREHVAGDPELAWALGPAERPGRLARLREKLHLVVVPLVLLPFVPLLLLALPLLPRRPLAARAPRRGPARQGVAGTRARAGGARGPHRPEPVHGRRAGQAGSLPERPPHPEPLRARLRHPPRLQPRRASPA